MIKDNDIWDRLPRTDGGSLVLIDWDTTLIQKFCKAMITFSQYRKLWRIIYDETSIKKITPTREIIKIIRKYSEQFDKENENAI